ncbi:hypothetical protein DFH11DRAFT_1744949 [Phellopilus nigrolimitatus]|nr:hypothetical protein DFH11DRAFT_1744949 [Phellopilus nigrolimitatus]
MSGLQEILELLRSRRADSVEANTAKSARYNTLRNEIAEARADARQARGERVRMLEAKLELAKQELELEQGERNEELERDEQERANEVERDEVMRAQITEITGILQDTREECAGEKRRMDEQWDEKRSRRETKNTRSDDQLSQLQAATEPLSQSPAARMTRLLYGPQYLPELSETLYTPSLTSASEHTKIAVRKNSDKARTSLYVEPTNSSSANSWKQVAGKWATLSLVPTRAYVAHAASAVPRPSGLIVSSSSFDDDWYEKAERKKEEREREGSEKVGVGAAGGAVGAVDHDANDAPVVATQPAPATAMQAPLADGGAKTS